LSNFIRDSLNQFLNNPTWDILLILFFFAAVFVYGLMVGRNKIIVLLLASYPAALINEFLPYAGNFLNRFNAAQALFARAFFYLIILLFVFWVLGKAGFYRKEITKRTKQVLFLSFLNVGLWANVIFGYAIKFNSEVVHLAPLNNMLFASDSAHFIWFALPIIVLYWFERR
jgi:hypothetical protein